MQFPNPCSLVDEMIRSGLLDGEDPAALRAQHERVFTWFQPADPLEEFLIERLVVAQWRLCRAASMEGALTRYRLETEESEIAEEIGEMGRRCYAYMRDCAMANCFAKLDQHETRLHREYDACSKEIRSILAARKREAAPPVSVARMPVKRAVRSKIKIPATKP